MDFTVFVYADNIHVVVYIKEDLINHITKIQVQEIGKVLIE